MKPERTGWRDTTLSGRHRTLWGWDCPMVDLDWWVIEYESGRVTLIVDYKSWGANWPPVEDANATALGGLRDDQGKPVPLMFVRYHRDPWMFVVRAGNAVARQWFPDFTEGWVMTERTYVRWLYRARGREMPLKVGERLDERLLRGWASGPIRKAEAA